MIYEKINGLQKPVSRIVLGGSSGCLWRGENCDKLLDDALAMGVTTFDTARGYAKSEGVLGAWIEKRNVREKVVIQSKGALHGLLGNNRVKEKCIRKDLQQSLEALRTSYVDIYLLHRDNPKSEVAWIVELLNELHAEGKIKTFGASNWSHTRIEQANEYAYKHNLTPFSVSQPHFSLAKVERWPWIGCLSVAGPGKEEARAWYANSAFPLMAFSPLCGGFFAGRVKSEQAQALKASLSPAMRTAFFSNENVERLKRTEEIAQETGHGVPQVVLAWMMAQGMNVFPVVGCSSGERLKQNLTALEVQLTPAQCDYMDLKRDDY